MLSCPTGVSGGHSIPADPFQCRAADLKDSGGKLESAAYSD